MGNILSLLIHKIGGFLRLHEEIILEVVVVILLLLVDRILCRVHLRNILSLLIHEVCSFLWSHKVILIILSRGIVPSKIEIIVFGIVVVVVGIIILFSIIVS